ncbi:MAG: hypothetical protein PHY34_03365 [Patescibacteria group bacterium]|nr:hypothetical protein [Patescibacteria group bacterium]MDD5716086.1 hypothetical protein [Patescibacteria group bacterium]
MSTADYFVECPYCHREHPSDTKCNCSEARRAEAHRGHPDAEAVVFDEHDTLISNDADEP